MKVWANLIAEDRINRNVIGDHLITDHIRIDHINNYISFITESRRNDHTSDDHIHDLHQ
jgi:hypothetical protein